MMFFPAMLVYLFGNHMPKGDKKPLQIADDGDDNPPPPQKKEQHKDASTSS